MQKTSAFVRKMVDGLDMTLDDIIKKNKKSKANKADFGGRGRSGRDGGHGQDGSGGRGHGYGPWPTRSVLDRGPFSRMMPYSTKPNQWLHIRGKGKVGGPSYENAGTALHVSNLSPDVTHADIKVLFSDVGDLKRYTIHYDGSGRPKGTAEVVFERHSDALVAIRRYNNRRLDGKPMNIVLTDSDVVTSARFPASHDMETQTGSHGRGNGLMLAQGRGQKRGRREKVSAEALDADLEKYHEEAMRIM